LVLITQLGLLYASSDEIPPLEFSWKAKSIENLGLKVDLVYSPRHIKSKEVSALEVGAAVVELKY